MTYLNQGPLVITPFDKFKTSSDLCAINSRINTAYPPTESSELTSVERDSIYSKAEELLRSNI